jgi:hypothetical protein
MVPVLCLAIQETLYHVSTPSHCTRGCTPPSHSSATGSWYMKDRVLLARRAEEGEVKTIEWTTARLPVCGIAFKRYRRLVPCLIDMWAEVIAAVVPFDSRSSA